ncbi:hypothetical protein ACWAU3_03970 [Shewanella sp. JL219SE-S6]
MNTALEYAEFMGPDDSPEPRPQAIAATLCCELAPGGKSSSSFRMKDSLKSIVLRLTTRKISEKAKVSDISELLFVKSCSTIQARSKSATGNKEFYQGVT